MGHDRAGSTSPPHQQILLAYYQSIGTGSLQYAMNQFIARVVNHVVNEVIVAGLAKSRTFQRFAVRTENTLQSVQKASAESLLKQTFGEASAESSSTATATAAKNARSGGPPPKPLTGFPGFVSAFVKEVRHDLGLRS
jgi:hypothetical protein